MSALPQLQDTQDIDDNPLSDENLEAKEQERQDRARASLERLGLAGQMAIKRSKYAPLQRSSASKVEDTAVEQPVRVSENDNIERQQVGLLTRIWSVLGNINKTLERQVEFEEDQSIEDREKSLETVQGEPRRIDDKKDEGEGGMGKMVKMLLAGLGIELAPVIAGIAGLGVTLAAVSAFLKVPAVKEWQNKGGAIGFIGDKTGLWKGNPIHDALPDWMKTDLLTGKVDNDKQTPTQAEGETPTGQKTIAPVQEGSFKTPAIDKQRGRGRKAYVSKKDRNDVFNEVYSIAKKMGDVHPEVTAGQFAYESHFGAAMSGKNNPFGQKAKKGESFSLVPTHEEEHGRLVSKLQKFKNYDSVIDAIEEHIKRWTNKITTSHMSTLQAVQALKKAGYATKKSYVSELMGVINSRTIDNREPIQQPGVKLQQSANTTGTPSPTVKPAVDPNTGVKPTESDFGKWISGLTFGAPLTYRSGWARSDEQREALGPSLQQQVIRPERKKAPSAFISPIKSAEDSLKGITNHITNMFGAKSQQRAISVDSTGNIPSPSADTISLNYALYFHTK